MENTEVKKILCEQLALLAEYSKMLDKYGDAFDLVLLSVAMCVLANSICLEDTHVPNKVIMDAFHDVLLSKHDNSAK